MGEFSDEEWQTFALAVLRLPVDVKFPAYLLAANKVIGETDEMNAKTLSAVKMPNRDGFDWIDVKK